MKRKRKKFQKKNSNSLNKLSLFQKTEGRFNRSCPLSVKNAPVIDYKNISLLSKYVSENNKILSSKITSVSSGKQKKLTKEIKADIAYAFEDSITDVLVKKTIQALKQEGLKRVIISGGVGANKTLRKKIIAECTQNEFEYFFPDLTFCTDNGAMIALAGSLRLNMRPKENYSFSVKPRWKLTEI